MTVNSVIPVYDGENSGGEADQVPDVLQSQAQPSKQFRIRYQKGQYLVSGIAKDRILILSENPNLDNKINIKL